MGVWYTPNEIVRYMVERVDRVLRTELGYADGLADHKCGCWTRPVEPAPTSWRFCVGSSEPFEQGEDATVAAELKAAAMRRIAGFEIMPAPFVIAHWQVGNLLVRPARRSMTKRRNAPPSI